MIQGDKKQRKAREQKASDLLLEIGCEEIPAGYIQPALDAVRQHFVDFAGSSRISHGELRTWATPRRLTLFVSSVAEHQESTTEEYKGPPSVKARNPDGSYNEAAKKFAHSKGVDLSSLVEKETDKGSYIFAVKHCAGSKTAELLPGFLTSLPSVIPFPKRMRWGDGSLLFARPVRWLLFLFGGKVIRVKIDGMVSGAYSYGHRFLASKKIKIISPENYLTALEQHYVIADHNKRKEMIHNALKKSANGEVVIPPDLLDEVNFLIEFPFVASGSFPEEYLRIPPEIIRLCIEKNQRFFSVKSPDTGKFISSFLVVMNMPLEDSREVIAAYEKVLVARLKDAMFFYEEDIQIPLHQRVEQLKRVVFQKVLGTLYDKTLRLISLSETIAKALKVSEMELAALRRAASLCKADLTTSLVFEFPEAQGTAGRYYAEYHGEDAAAAAAIEEHYQPRTADDKIPASLSGAVLSISDKLDTIVGYFSAGIIPTGSEDPFSLRRQALGIIKILEGKNFAAPLHDLVRNAIENYPQELIPRERAGEILSAVISFFNTRFRIYMMESHGISYDVVDAIDLEHRRAVRDTLQLASDLMSLCQDTDFQEILIVFDRVSNILYKSATRDDFRSERADPALFQQEEERELHRLAQDMKEEWNKGEKSYLKYITALYRLTPAAHKFFDNVLVMIDDPAVRSNRLALLREVRDVYLQIADFSKIVKKAM
ncbi:MAG: glycine--tRNA ligase subunit beta [bacterium]